MKAEDEALNAAREAADQERAWVMMKSDAKAKADEIAAKEVRGRSREREGRKKKKRPLFVFFSFSSLFVSRRRAQVRADTLPPSLPPLPAPYHPI